MKAKEVSEEEYRRRFPQPLHVFNSLPFIALNAAKVDRVRYILTGDEGRTRMGLVAGQRDGMLLSPFSAPYGGPDFSRDEKIEKVAESVSALGDFARAEGLKLRLTLPPAFHSPSMLTKISTLLLNRHGVLRYADFNYHYDLSRAADFEKHLQPNSRRNFHTALRSEFRFEQLGNSDAEISRAYEIIRINHESLGHALRMSRQAVIETAKILPCDFFMLTLGALDVAAAQIYHVAPGIVQLINWGDIPECRHLRPMNFMAWKVIEHYSAAGLSIYDLGPASEDGVPAAGLCDFKASLGCTLSMKFSFELH